MLRQILTAAALATALAGPAGALDDPDQLIRAVYAAKSLPTTPEESDRLLARDVSAAYKLALAADEPKPATDFDWRYSAQEWEITELEVGKAMTMVPTRIDGVTFSDVTVDFKNFGKRYQITWTLCLAAQGWRVADVRDGHGGWTLRKLLEIPAGEVQC